jgi:hypothetical protein
MDRPSLRWCTAIASVAGLSLAFLLSSVHAAQTPATPATPDATDCGAAISSWGPATVDDIQVALLRLISNEEFTSASPVATPSAVTPATHFAELEITNISNVAANVVAHDIKLVLCDGSVLDPTDDRSYPPLGDVQVPAGELRSGWVAFAVPANAEPVRLIVPVSRPGMSGGRVEFPLVDAQSASGTTAAVGADAVGGDAVGGDGGDGADATAESGT